MKIRTVSHFGEHAPGVPCVILDDGSRIIGGVCASAPELLRENVELRAALALGQANCDAVYDDLRQQRDGLRKLVRDIADMTDPDNENSYRGDDSEGCLDTVHAKCAAIAKATGGQP